MTLPSTHMESETEAPGDKDVPAERANFAQLHKPADRWLAVALWGSIAFALICFGILVLS